MFADGGWELAWMRCAQDPTISLMGAGAPAFLLEKYKLAKLEGIGTFVHEFWEQKQERELSYVVSWLEQNNEN